MPLILEGAPFNIGGLRDQQTREDELLRKYQEDAQARNDADAARTRQATGAGFEFKQHEADQAFQRSREDDARNYQHTQDALQQAHQAAQLTQQSQLHADDLSFKQAKEKRDAEEFDARMGQMKAMEQDRQTNNAAVLQARHEAGAAKLDADQAHVLATNRAKMYDLLPDYNDNVIDALARKRAGMPQLPAPAQEIPDQSREGGVEEATAELARREAFKREHAREMMLLQQQQMEGLKDNRLRIGAEREHAAKLAQERADAAAHPERFEELALKLREEIAPLISKTTPFLAYEFAKAVGEQLPEKTNPLQEEEMARLAAEAEDRGIDPLSGKKYTARTLWYERYKKPKPAPYMISLAQRIKQSVQGQPVAPNSVTAAPQQQPKPTEPTTEPTEEDKHAAEFAGEDVFDPDKPRRELPNDMSWGPRWSDAATPMLPIMPLVTRGFDKWNQRKEQQRREAISRGESPTAYDEKKTLQENKAAGYMTPEEVKRYEPRPEVYKNMPDGDLQTLALGKGPQAYYAQQELFYRNRDGALKVAKPAAKTAPTPTPTQHQAPAPAPAQQDYPVMTTEDIKRLPAGSGTITFYTDETPPRLLTITK